MSTDVIIFIDALSPREVSGVLENWKQGNMDSGSPRVTPRVMSSIYTGLNPAENGMMEVSLYEGEQITRPEKSTFIDQTVREDMSVLSMGMPFCIPFRQSDVNCEELDVLLHGAGIGDMEVFPPQAQNLVLAPSPDADMIKEHPDRVYASFIDRTKNLFHLFKDNIRRVEPDIAFLGYRLVDSYCHFQHTESRQGKPYRQHLIDTVADLCRRINMQVEGDVLFFSDHGQTELTDVFRVNRWLKQKGYLEYKVDYDFISTFNEWQGEDHPAAERVENQVTHQQPGVTVNKSESDVICSDPFDSCLTLITEKDEFDLENFRQDLLSTGMYRKVDFRWELYDESADNYNTVPHVIPDRDKGVFVSGNMHKEPIGMGYYRTGVHDYTACFGATCELSVPDGTGRDGMITPEQMYQVIKDFIGLEITTSPIGHQLGEYTRQELELIHKDVEKVI